ncbi:hypothetical protein QFZ20_000776 [Flavobacterium sp. W4I14]|nr:hypothetical protein [Flavobacterium sp. W4I14]
MEKLELQEKSALQEKEKTADVQINNNQDSVKLMRINGLIISFTAMCRAGHCLNTGFFML